MTRDEAKEKIINDFCKCRVWCELYPDMCQTESCEIWWALKALKIETEQQWIPCSERLPEENEVVLTQARFADDIKMAVSARIDYNYWTGWGTREVNVVAWMPLPSPWKGDK